MKGAESFERNERHIRVADDYAQMKNAVYLSSKKVLDRLAELHGLEEKHVIALENEIMEKLIHSNKDTIPELQTEALEEVKRILKNFGIDELGIQKDFVEELNLEMKTF